jgi:hypothetical protein
MESFIGGISVILGVIVGFPALVVYFHGRSERKRNRRASARRTDKFDIRAKRDD